MEEYNPEVDSDRLCRGVVEATRGQIAVFDAIVFCALPAVSSSNIDASVSNTGASSFDESREFFVDFLYTGKS